ncbi:MAG: phosphoribosylformylglycinamidine synthase, partial [Candidatus Levybacteria bacterium]|nr:phosphoribosylformylglycinamidine synthase [Candidatus Levybacteria bacterium]
MLQKIRVQTAGRDGKAEDILSDIKQMLKLSGVQKVETVKVYRLEGIGEKQANLLAENLLHERINQRYTLNKEFPTNKATVIEIAYKPGVMNPEVASIRKAAGDLGINLKAVDASWEYIFHGVADRTIGEEIALKIRLYNPLIEHVVVEEPKTLLIEGAVGKTVVIQIRKMSDDALLAVSKDKLFLNLEEMKVIQRYFQKIKRDPTDLELETLAQTWSEHCAHKTFKAKLIVDGKEKEPLMSRIKKEALKYNKHIVSAFVDNSGVMDFYNGYAINGKAETHNSPSAIEPYGGAMTGSGGV